MNSERNPHVLSDPSGAAGCVIGSSTPGPIHGYGSPPGSHGGSGGGVDMAVGPPCPVPTPPWVKPPSNNGNSGMMTPESDVSSCSSPASTSYGASSTSFPSQQQQHLHQQQQRSFYGSSASFNNCANNSISSGGDPNANAGVVHTTMNQIGGGNHSTGYCSTPNSNSNAISSSTNNSNNSGMFYDSTGEVQYYHHQQQQQHHFQQQFATNNSLHSLHQQKAGACNSPSLENNVNLSGDCVGGENCEQTGHGPSGGQNFYGFYNTNQSGQYADYHHQQQHHHNPHQQHHIHHHDGYSAGGDVTGGNRMHQYYRQDGGNSGTSANGVPVGHANYFGGGDATGNANYPTSSGNSTPPTRYGSPMMFPNNHTNYVAQQQQQQQQQQSHHHLQGQQMPMRRNSIESYSSEPGDMHSSYSARYGCSSANNPVNTMNQQQPPANMQISTNHQSQHHPHNPFTSGVVNNSGMIKRECSGMTSRGSPSMNPMTPPNGNVNQAGCWSPHPPQGGGAPAGYYPAASPNHNCSSTSSSPNPCSNNVNNGNRTNFMTTSYNQQGMCATGESECANNFYSQQQHHASHHHQQTPTTQFKSCAYEQSQQHHDIKEGISSMVASPGNNLKAASAIKHRSLSLSMPLPSYMDSSGSPRPDMENNFHRQLSHHQHPHSHHHQQTMHNNHHNYNPMMDATQQQHHQQCSTTGLVPPPDQNLLTPNSDDDIPFRAASAGGQSDLDSSYETMGDEGCSSTSTSVASHCMSSTINTSGSSSCSAENNPPVAIINASRGHNMHPMSMDTVNVSDCHHHHHHHHGTPYSTGPVVSSCMQSQHHHIATTMSMGMLELPNSTVALCSSNVDDLDESSSDSTVALHNAISAVVENSSIETPENTMMGDDDDELMGEPVSDEIPSESGLGHHHFQSQDSQTNVNIISTTTSEPDEHNAVDDDDDNCSESSMSHINSSFTADMFCNTSSNDVDDDDSNNLIMSSDTNVGASDKVEGDVINSSSNNNDYSCIPEESHFSEDTNIEGDGDSTNENVSLTFHAFKKSSSSPASVPTSFPTNSTSMVLSTASTPPPSFSVTSPSTSSPQKISKRSFSETDTDKVAVSTKLSTTSSSSSSTSSSSSSVVTAAWPSSTTATTLASFGASFGRNKIVSGESNTGSNNSGEMSESVGNESSKCVLTNKKENDGNSANSSGINNKNVSDVVNCGNNSNTSVGTASNGTISGCKALDIIIRNSNNAAAAGRCGGGNNNIDIDNNTVIIPKGWKREILKGSANDNGASNSPAVLYISPSDTKIRNLDELKNYIGSDGTCKCGLSCPLRLEVAFSFDPKVTNMTAEDEKENLESLHAVAAAAVAAVATTAAATRNDTSTSSSSTSSTESDAKLLCNHKRKIPKAEDSPLISSTRDDLGDFGEKLKKRRLSGNECLGEKLVSSGPFKKDPITTSASNNNKNVSSPGSGRNNNSGSNTSNNNSTHNVPVPFCQQSPDTTTQTPQTEMSPASSVCSDSSTILFSSAGSSSSGGNRSLTSTPTPTLSSSSTSSSTSLIPTAAPAPTTKVGSSPSQGQGHCEFVWPSAPPTLGVGSNLSSSIPPLGQHQSAGTFWLNPTNNSLTTFPTSASSSNSLTLNYVQTPSNIIGNVVGGSCVPSPTINNIVIGPSPIPTSNSVKSSPTTLTTSSTTVVANTTTATSSSVPTTTPAKKTYAPYPSKTVKRPSSPCPNIDVRQLPLEQNRPPPVSPAVAAPSPILPSKIATVSPTTVCSNAITNLPTLPVVTNSNILFTVAPPIMATNKTEIVGLSTPTLPILPLLTTTGKLPTVGPLDTTCGPPTIVTTLQPNTGLFSTIDTIYPAATPIQSKVEITTSIAPSTLSPRKQAPVTSSAQQSKKESSGSAVTSNVSAPSNNGSRNDQSKKKSEPSVNNTTTSKIRRASPSPAKSPVKDGKEKVTSGQGSAGGDSKSPLQLAQDIVNRFEKKSGDKKLPDGKVNNNNNIGESGTTAANNSNAIASTTTPSKESKEEKVVKDKPKIAPKSTKVGHTKAEEKCKDTSCNNGAAAAKVDLPSLLSSSSTGSQPGTTSKTDVIIIGSGTNKSETKANEPDANKKSTVDITTKSSSSSSGTPEVIVIQSSSNDKSKLPVDPSKQPQTTSIAATPPPTVVNTTVPLNTVVVSTPQLQPTLGENAIITSQTSVVGTTPLIFKDGLQLATTDQGLTLTTSVSGPIPTISLSAVGNQIIQTSGGPPVPCSTTTLTTGGLGTFAPAAANQIIFPHGAGDQANGANSTFLSTSTAAQGTTPLRYPILQTIQPLFLNSAGHAGGPLIFSQPTQQHDPTHGNPTLAQPSFIYDHNGTPTATIDTTGVGAFQSMLQPATTTMVLDPSICAGNANLTAGGKKKKKRLSKKQQQQQAQLQLQQHLILQQIQAQQQQAAAAAIAPLTIFPQSFNLGPQGFSLQPTMNFFPTPTILTLPNLILNPADGTLFIQPSTPLPTATTAQMQPTTMKLGQFPLTTTTTIPQNPQNIAPKKDGIGATIIQNINEPLKPASTPGLDSGSDDSRQNPTPDSSTNDLQLGLINVAATGPTSQPNTITLNIPAPTTTTVLHTSHSPVVNNKKNSKSRTVSSSSATVKRILPQKQILPKIDSTTPSTTENAN